MSYLLAYNPGAPQYTYPRRGGVVLSGTAIIHTAECAMDLDGDDSSAEVCAAFIANRADYGSYHRLVDSDSIIDMLPWEYEAWQDSETNNWAVGISAAVQAGKWDTIPAARRDRIYRNMAACAADFVNYMAGKGVTVPLRRISGAQARARVPGFCAHGDSGISRSDPGTQFDWGLLFAYTAQALTGSLFYAGTITPLEEDELPFTFDDLKRAATEGALAALDYKVDNTTGGKTSVLDVPRIIDARFNQVPGAVLDEPVGRQGGAFPGVTSLRGVLAYSDQQHIEQLQASAAAAHSDGVAVEDIIAAVREALAAGIKIDATVKVGE